MTKRKQSGAGSGGGAKRLSEAALKQVEEHAAEIAEGLMKGARDGKCMSIRLLIELAEASAEAKKALEAHPLLSLALQLAAEREMPDDAAGSQSLNDTQTQN